VSVRHGRGLLVLSIFTRCGVVALLCLLALNTSYLNLKLGYNSPRLVELSSGTTVRHAYELADRFWSWFGDPLTVAQHSGGMTWSIRLFGVPFTDPMAALSVAARNPELPLGFALGLLVPLGLALLFGRVFCAYICPASLLFFSIARLRRVLSRWFYFPELPVHRGFGWGIVAGSLIASVWVGHGIWSLILPYFAMGQTLFQGLAMGTLSATLGSLIVFSMLDLILGRQFTCRHVCPTGRVLGLIGRRSVFAVRRNAEQCVPACTACTDVCPLRVNPKVDQTRDCSMCGECLVVCPTHCLSMGPRAR